ncbi:LuxR C-terminal-related transcriptional regulator [Actinoplanes teichomyceticus]|uniref:LuxR family maltose regulon positive regulatory protein n=1 Tax=Actinoplanes teichomyceticus TaxID=1867 RepID=A0A561WK74_ACTTI|nr:LuxR C-terminal-related transcriptional regulator [Actinoplanes teichomyceticus]TWG24248.1 LuxR family maltose regulon positive regulatory protein [Actinoplanes teichomyceticus]GIF12906.1 transcriptional regulator [Actinoplanes teichomyceticus]
MTSETTVHTGTGTGPAAGIDPLLAAKFTVPDTPPFAVRRTRLLDRLGAAVQQPITVVTGPPGSGKTVLAASWAASGRAPGPTVWISLEEGDDVPAVFWPYLVEGLSRAGITLSPTIDEAIGTGAFERPLLARLAADLAAHHGPVVLILDNASMLTDRRLAEDLDALLRHADKHLRLVLAGRWDPPLPLYRYRLAGTLSEIRAGDLAFTVAEAADLLSGHAVALPERAVRALVEHTEGWAVGLRMFALAAQGRGDAEELIATVVGDESNLAEYFLGEVLASQPPQAREFLLCTSIVDDFTLDLAETLVGRGDARHIVDRLERANAFLQPVAHDPAVHRYHRLFGELLRAQLAYEDPARVPELHRRAAAWFAARGRPVDAVRHAVSGGDWRHASTVLLRDLGVGHLLAGGESDRLVRLFHDMPDDVDGPEAELVTAARWLARTDPERAAAHLRRAAERADAAATDPATAPVRATAALLDTVASAMRGDVPRALRSAETAGALLARLPAEHPELDAIRLFWRSVAQGEAGALDDAIATLTDATRALPPSGWDGLRLSCLERLALLNAYQGRLCEAVAAAGQAAQLNSRHRAAQRPRPAVSAALAWVDAERWSAATAWAHLRAAEGAGADDPLVAAAVALVRSRLLSGRGEFRSAATVLDEAQARDDAGRRPRWLHQEITVNRAQLAVSMGSPDEALATVATLDDRDSAQAVLVSAAARLAKGEARQAADLVKPILGGAGSPPPLLIDAWLISAAAASEQGEPAATVHQSLQRALTLAAPDGHRRPFHQGGPRLRRLLRGDPQFAAARRPPDAPPERAAPAEASSVAAPPGTPILVDPLSERELEVLHHLAAMLGTEEIADAMYLSVNTVKTHVRSILRKLAAPRRNEAVRRARALGLV